MTFRDAFKDLKDHRMNRTKLHSLESILFIALAAVIGGAETWNEIEEFGNEKIDWFRKHLDLPNGIPSHDTFNRFFSALDPDKFEECFRKWVSSIGIESNGDVVSIDGKSIRGAKTSATSAIHIVSAWSKNGGVTLGQKAIESKGGELRVIPDLLDALFIEGSIVTIDALGAQPSIAEVIVNNGADYVLQIKNNRRQMVRDIQYSFDNREPHSISESVNKSHGRQEKRVVSVLYYPELIRNHEQWINLSCIIKLESESIHISSDKVEKSTAYYISSLNSNAEYIANVIRSHWGIENSLHWVLDVAFSEDRGRKQDHNSVVNFSLLNKIAMDMLRREDSVKIGIKSKRMKAGWGTSYLEKILGI